MMNPRRANEMAWVRSHIGTVLSIATALAAIISSYAVAQYQIGDLRDAHRTLRASQEIDHDTITEIRQDVRWIRSAIEKKEVR